MKKSNKRWLRFVNSILGGLLILLGFANCEGITDGPVEYGMPHATYELKGKVTNQTEQAVSGIQIIVQGIVQQGSNYVKSSYPDTLYTDLKGSFIYKDESAWPGSKLRVIYKDVSLTAIPTRYKTDSIDVDMGELSGGSSWYKGIASKDIQIELVEKTIEPQ